MSINLDNTFYYIMIIIRANPELIQRAMNMIISLSGSQPQEVKPTASEDATCSVLYVESSLQEFRTHLQVNQIRNRHRSRGIWRGEGCLC